VDRDPSEWPRDAKGELEMTTAPLDLDALLMV
jgi:catechol-2,3-dioxygenase